MDRTKQAIETAKQLAQSNNCPTYVHTIDGMSLDDAGAFVIALVAKGKSYEGDPLTLRAVVNVDGDVLEIEKYK